jgi:hypothetical protein
MGSACTGADLIFAGLLGFSMAISFQWGMKGGVLDRQREEQLRMQSQIKKMRITVKKK